MSTAIALNWRQVELGPRLLIEASAGTGKTYNIALLYLRLLLEHGHSVRQILVTTFTEAAAEELKARIRQRLVDAERYLSQPAPPTQGADADLHAYLDERATATGRSTLQLRLHSALMEIDLAPISTIHGFCRRVLAEFPFETGVAFSASEVVDEAALLRECVQDYWRQRYLRADIDPFEIAFVLQGGPEGLLQRIRPLLEHESSTILRGDSEAVRALWTSLSADNKALRALCADAGIYKRSDSALCKRLNKLLQAIEKRDPSAVDWVDLAKELNSEKVNKSIRNSNDIGKHPLLAKLIALGPQLRAAPMAVAADVAVDASAFVRQQLAARLLAGGQTTYGRMIGEVYERICGAHGEALAAHLQQAWPAALIDEFQDTDSRQWAIFERLYADRGQLVLIGDPKQAIYGFRGGDVHAYLAARATLPADARFSIAQNFRSSPALLDACNALYAVAGKTAFATDVIEYQPVSAGDGARWPKRPEQAPLVLHALYPERTQLSERDDMTLDACASAIVHLLNDPDARIDGRQVQPGDIAVLLDTNLRLGMLRERLCARGVPVVGAGKASVGSTELAAELQLLLYALLHLDDEQAWRGALATRLLGGSAAELAACDQDPARREQHWQRFLGWRRIWQQRGILAMVEALLQQQAPRLLADSDGERVLTDLRHLGELLEEAASDCYGDEELYQWLLQLRSGASADEDAARQTQLRIESEAQRVQLMTVHASKGLEFAIVLVPMAWRPIWAGRGSGGPARFHDASFRLRMDLGSADYDRHKEIEAEEDLQERMRKLYVAITRARHSCHLYAQADLVAVATPSTLAGELTHLLAPALTAAGSWSAIPGVIPGLQVLHSNASNARYRAEAASTATRQARGPMPDVRPRHGAYSYSSLIRMQADHQAAEARRAADEGEAEASDSVPELLDLQVENAAHPQLLALADLRGPRFGDAMHALLETGRGNSRYGEQAERIAGALREFGVDQITEANNERTAAVGDLLDRCVDTELAPGLQLAQLAAAAQRAEFEFTLALDGAQFAQLHHVLKRHGLGDWWPETQTLGTLNGLLKGYIDLVFAWDGRYHVLDYKTNWLGDRLDQYTDAALDQAMREHRYGLQALIYQVALHRYLGRRLDDYDPQQHLGECWYLFLRALGLQAGSGVWRRRFALALIEDLDRLFAGQEASA